MKDISECKDLWDLFKFFRKQGIVKIEFLDDNVILTETFGNTIQYWDTKEMP